MTGNLTPLNIFLIGVFGLFGVGLYGLLATRNLIKFVAVLQILVKSAVLALVLAGKVSDQVNLGQSLAMTVIVADTVVAVIGLALAVQVRQHTGTLDIDKLTTLKG
jgi:NADH:ubiquinone oxidoreductase subunit K